MKNAYGLENIKIKRGMANFTVKKYLRVKEKIHENFHSLPFHFTVHTIRQLAISPMHNSKIRVSYTMYRVSLQITPNYCDFFIEEKVIC